MEKLTNSQIDSILLQFDQSKSAVANLEKQLVLTSDLISEERQQNISYALQCAIIVETQLRLRGFAQQPNLDKVMEQALGPKGLCSAEVILRKLEELLPYKQLHSLVLLRAQQSLDMNLKPYNEYIHTLKVSDDIKLELDKLPNLRAALAEGLFGDWIINKTKENSEEIIFAALSLLSGT